MKVKIVAIDRSGTREEIRDLYWFEEQGVHAFDDARYRFEFVVDGVPLTEATGARTKKKQAKG